MIYKEIPVNTLGRDFVVGDIHGCFDRLELLLSAVGFNKLTDRLFSVGDLVDRGPNSLEVLRLIKQPWFHAVMGNHEWMMLEGLTNSFHLWYQNGGNWFFELDEQEQNEVSLELVPYVKRLPWMLTVALPGNKRFHVVHAEIQPIQETTDGDILVDHEELLKYPCMDGPVALWGRSHFVGLCSVDLTPRNLKKHRKRAVLHGACQWMDSPHLSDIYVGHTPMNAPVRFDKLVNLDTFAYGLYKGRYKRCGLTMTEPLTGKFWTANLDDVQEVECLVVPDEGDSREI